MNEREFLDRVDRSSVDGCWPWLGASRASNGAPGARRGALRWNGRVELAYRVAWELEHGSPPPADKMVCHHCDNPICVRPDHLFLGTAADNVRDMVNKGRNSWRVTLPGVEHHAAKLADAEIGDVLDLVASGLTYKEVAHLFGVDHSSVGHWVNGKARRAARDAWLARLTAFNAGTAKARHAYAEHMAELEPPNEHAAANRRYRARKAEQ